MAVKFYRTFYKLGLTYLAVGIFTYSCAHTLRIKDSLIEGSNRSCVVHFANNVDSCLKPFLATVRHQRQKNKSSKLLQSFSQKTFCLHYEETLQCLHKTIKECDKPETMAYVQEKLSASWVLAINKLCNINMKNESASTDSASSTKLYVTIETQEPDTAGSKFKDTINVNKNINDNMQKDITVKTGDTFSTKVTNQPANTSEDSNYSDLKFKPSDTHIQTQTNIHVYLNPTDDNNPKILFKELGSQEMSITLEEREDQRKKKRWGMKIGKLLFQHRKLL